MSEKKSLLALVVILLSIIKPRYLEKTKYWLSVTCILISLHKKSSYLSNSLSIYLE